MLQIVIGSFLLSMTHALIPNHWFPLAAVSKSEGWTRTESIQVTAVTGFLHTLSTIAIGIIIGFIGFRLGDSVEITANIVAPILLILLGIIFIIRNFRAKSHEHTHCHVDTEQIKQASKKSKKAIITALGTMMFFSPCMEIEAYYFTAGQHGWAGILVLSVIYLIVTVISLVIVVQAGRKSLDLLNKKLHFLEHHEKAITGIILILLGVISFFINH